MASHGQAGCSDSHAPPLLERLWLWIDPRARSGPENMAVDEWLLLRRPPVPVLRVYQWSHRAVSFGYAEKWAPVAEQFHGFACVRRWTGGGVVEHGRDQTYTLVLPKPAASRMQNSVAVYGWVHGQLALAIGAHGFPAVCLDEEISSSGRMCFAAPVRHDVLVGGHKVAGAGQRRTRDGLLHQGSVQGPAAKAEVLVTLAGLLAHVVEDMPTGFLPPDSEVTSVAAGRYASPSWTFAR